MTNAQGAAPLAGIRVLEVGNFMAGPFCAMNLADLGADVVKVENPDGGDVVRNTAPFLNGESSNFIRLNRNKRSLAIDLKHETGKQLFLKLATRADIVVENLRPGTMRSLGLDYPVLSALNPRLIYVAASGWGQDGPYAAHAGMDIMAQAMSGLMSITGEEGRPPVKAGVPVCDLTCALYGALGAVSALYAREQSGCGQLIDVSLFEAGVSLAVWESGEYFGSGEIPRRRGSAHQASAPYQALRSADGYFVAGATTPKTWVAFCKVLAIESLIDDPRFAQPHARLANIGRAAPPDRGRHRDQEQPRVGRRPARCRRTVRDAARLRPGVQRPPSARPKLLCRRSARDAGAGARDRLADAVLADAGDHASRRPVAGRGLGNGSRRDRPLRGRDRELERTRHHRRFGRAHVSEDILTERRGRVLWITFNRPQSRNAMKLAMYERLLELCAEIDADDELRAVVLTGAGDKAFVAGTDISEFDAFKQPEDALAYEHKIGGVVEKLEAVRIPLIAAIGGACTGGGMSIATACDLRIATPSSRFGFPVARTLGNCLSIANYARLIDIVGPTAVKEMVYLAKLIDAPRALDLGFLNEVLPQEDGLLGARRGDRRDDRRQRAAHDPRHQRSAPPNRERGPRRARSRPDPELLHEQRFSRGHESVFRKAPRRLDRNLEIAPVEVFRRRSERFLRRRVRRAQFEDRVDAGDIEPAVAAIASR